MANFGARFDVAHALLVARGGSKMKAVAEAPEGFRGTTFGGRFNAIMPMTTLALLLARFETDRPIIDLTGLSGLYEVKLEWSLTPRVAGAEIPPGPTLYTAVEEQLGLKLEARKGPVEVLVVESAEKVPAAN